MLSPYVGGRTGDVQRAGHPLSAGARAWRPRATARPVGGHEHAGLLSCSGRPKREKNSGERKAVISSIRAAWKVSTMMVSALKAVVCSSQRYPATAGWPLAPGGRIRTR